jgi:hypothetical protein
MAEWNWALGIQRPAALAISAVSVGFVNPWAPYCADAAASAAAPALAWLARDREACAAGVAGLPQ